MENAKKVVVLIKKGLDKTVNYLVIFLMFTIVIVVFAQVFSRYVLNSPFTWSEELARYLFIWIIFLSSVVVFRENRHMSVDFFVSLLPPKPRRIIDVLGKIVIAMFLITIIYVAPTIINITMKQTSPTLSIPMGAIYIAFPLALGLMLLELIFRVLLYKRNKEEKVGGQ